MDVNSNAWTSFQMQGMQAWSMALLGMEHGHDCMIWPALINNISMLAWKLLNSMTLCTSHYAHHAYAHGHTALCHAMQDQHTHMQSRLSFSMIAAFSMIPLFRCRSVNRDMQGCAPYNSPCVPAFLWAAFFSICSSGCSSSLSDNISHFALRVDPACDINSAD